MKKLGSILLIVLSATLLSCGLQNTDTNKIKYFSGFMIDAPRGVETIDSYFRLIDFCNNEGINVILFRLTDDQGSAYLFTSHPELKMCEGAFTTDELKSIVEYADKKGVEIIPEIESFGHSKYITKSEKYKFLNDAPEGADFNALCPVNDSSLFLLNDLYTEVSSIFNSKYIHIGCDEVNWGESERSKNALKTKSKSQIWAEYVNQLNEHVKELGKETMIWGDVPVYHEKEVLDQLCKDIVIIDWNYWETNVDTIANVANRVLDKGFKLIACPAVSWCLWGPRVGISQFENISAYAKVYNKLNNQNNLGIILSNWVPTRYLQNSQWDTYTIATHLLKNADADIYKDILPIFVEKHFGVEFNANWEKIFKTVYEDIPQWKCADSSSIFIPWNSEEQIKKIIEKNTPVKNNFTGILDILSNVKDSVKINIEDFDALFLTIEFIEYNLKRENDLLSFVQSQNVSLNSTKHFFKKVALEDQSLKSRMDSAWHIGRYSRNPGGINDMYLWAFNKAANYSKYLSENPKEFQKMIIPK